ncbi:MAG TPA: DUF1552 domain-containing protein [Polyangiaceae bacterium]|jgi:hypothetical protein|nr:DUF1552 domain-containing protein [Polyangiaceae bacterium]
MDKQHRRDVEAEARIKAQLTPRLALPRVNRRQVLRGLFGGAVVTVGLPIFECMLNDNGTAFAEGGEIPTRFGIWFHGNGVRLNSWMPVNTGPDWQPPGDGELEPLLPHKDYVSVVSGLSVKTPRHAHHSGMATICTGGPHLKISDVRDTIVSTFKYKSVDQIAADYFMSTAPTPYRSLEVAVTRFRGTDEGTTFQYLSHNGSMTGETNVNPSEESPHAFFDRLFGQGTAEPLVRKSRASVLDAVGEQITSLHNRLGTRDQHRLDQHLSSVRDIEQRLNASLAACVQPADPGDFPDLEGNEQMAEKNKAMSDLMAVALACGFTRAFSIMFSTCGSGCVMWPAGATDGQHYMNHTEAAPYNKQHGAMRFTMEQLAYFLDRLKNTPEGADSNLLEHTSLLVCTEHTEGWTHSQDDMPVLVCGHGGGRLRGNYHHREPDGNTTRALITALRGAGLPLTEFGYEAGHVTNWISELETA